MNLPRHPVQDDENTLPRMPSWVTPLRGQALEDVAFLSGAALGHLHLVLTHQSVPLPLLRNRLVLDAAEACVAVSGRPERAGDLRDEVGLLRAGDQAGPAGQVYQMWLRAVERTIAVKSLHRALPHVAPEQIAVWLDSGDVGQGGPVGRAALVLETVLTDAPRSEAAGLMLADAALAQALGWDNIVPIVAKGLARRDLRKTGDALRLACHGAVVASAIGAVRMANDLARRTARLRAVAPKLRAKGSDAAVEMFLTQDAVAPTALTSLGSDRAARRFCDRLVELGVARELTGRETFRLYGI